MRHDIFAIHIASPDEAQPQLKGDLLLVDAEDRMRRDITVTPALLHAYRAEFERHCKAVENYCGRYELGYLRSITDCPLLEKFGKITIPGDIDDRINSNFNITPALIVI